MLKKVRLKPGKEKPLLNHHHWIFSGAVAELPMLSPGEILPVESHGGVHLGYAYFNPKSSILGRMISFGEEPISAVEKALLSALELRRRLFGPETTAYRLINGEGDHLPGLIVDKYDQFLVMQISTLGMEKLKPAIIDFFKCMLCPQGILEKSLLPSRKEEGLEPLQIVHFGEFPEHILIKENGLSYLVDPIKGQKTGFFLDQREMRRYVQMKSNQKRVLNCFSYTGGFTMAALSGGAESAVSVDISEEAIEGVRNNCRLNQFSLDKAPCFAEDVFEFLRESHLDYDLVILDPPAFAKKAKDIVSACRGYKEINRLALQKMPANSLLLTSSCSYHIDEKLFQQVLFQAAAEAKREVRILAKHRHAEDHPVNLFHPEGSYLKSLALWIG